MAASTLVAETLGDDRLVVQLPLVHENVRVRVREELRRLVADQLRDLSPGVALRV